MPGRLFLHTPLPDLAALWDAAPAGLRPDHERANIAPGQRVLAMVADGAGGRRIERMRWGMIPVGRTNARGRPVLDTIINARGETVFSKSAFAGTGRAIVPADGWYEWTGRQGRKTAWRIRPADGAPLAFAAITDVWHAPGGQALAQLATVTCAPSHDVAKLHDRMGVLLSPAGFRCWLEAPAAEAAALIGPWPAGRLVVERADDVDFTGP